MSGILGFLHHFIQLWFLQPRRVDVGQSQEGNVAITENKEATREERPNQWLTGLEARDTRNFRKQTSGCGATCCIGGATAARLLCLWPRCILGNRLIVIQAASVRLPAKARPSGASLRTRTGTGPHRR